MDGVKWSNLSIVSPGDHSGNPNAAETTIGSVGMHRGQRFLYLFDYGAEWTFTVTVDDIQEEAASDPIEPYIFGRLWA